MSNFTVEPVKFFIGTEALAGLKYVPEHAQHSLPAVLIFHGRGSSKKRYIDRAEVLTQAGFLTLIFDFRGCGESDGNFVDQTLVKGWEDAVASYDFLISDSRVDTKRIGVWGGSYGGYLAALLSTERRVSSLLLAAPAIYQDEWWDIAIESFGEKLPHIYHDQKNLDTVKPMKALETYAGNLLVVEHEFDEIIPSRIPQAYYDHAIKAQLREYTILPNTQHILIDAGVRADSIEITREWFVRTLL